LSNLAHQIQHKREQQTITLPDQQTVIVRRRSTITLGEKVLFLLFAAVMLFFASQVIASSVSVYQANADIQKLEQTITVQHTTNNDLRIQVDELSNYERIWAKAKELGLTLNQNNVKNIQE
jgi:cell division protein FtsL